ncbi:scavenger receptor cysteine-rich domain-containing group B protein-like [Montipora foliosa]|uniref:scavenger receptor cysteine-rich domain-containing group B protein-like n=1 Tax=Montipora foliosa TaxID=591990 RepID=UPI0035F12EE1
MRWHWAAVFLLSATSQALNITFRLNGSSKSFAGRVEVKYNGTWGMVCNDGFHINVGHVICRELGYLEAVAVPCCNPFGEGVGDTWLAGFECRGNESKLTQCYQKKWRRHDCDYFNRANLVCRARNITVSSTMPVRLYHATVPYAGCVEVQHAGFWGDIGQYGWDLPDGQVACRQLGYRDVVTVLWRCRIILPESRSIYSAVTWVDNVRCHGSEGSLNNCSRDIQTHRSSLGFDAGVVCKNETERGLKLRLFGATVPFAGRVEVYMAGKWGAIDRYTWELRDAHVACRQLRNATAELAIRGATYMFDPRLTSKGMKIQWLENVHCLGNESMLHECPHNVSFTPGPVLEAGVICKSDNLERKIRLAGSKDPFAGRLEVFIAGIWGTVRNNGWNMTSSNVACRQLGYRGANAYILFSVEKFGKGQGPVWMSGVNCKGHEKSLWECPFSKIAGIYWDHDNDIGLVCQTDDHGGDKSEWKRYLIIALPVSAVVILIMGLIVLYFRCWYKKRNGAPMRGNSMNMKEVSSSTDVGMLNAAFKNGESTMLAKENKEEGDWPEIPRERISLGKKIGTEFKAVTFHGRLLLENGNLANCIVKTCGDFPAEKVVSTKDENNLLTELKIMSCLGSHLNILNLFGACTIQGPTYLVFEYAEHGSLLDYLQQNQMNVYENNSSDTKRTLSSLQKLKIALDIARGMKHIAEKKFIHKDLATRNIRLCKNLVAKVTNINSACSGGDGSLDDNIPTETLPREKWMSPELLENSNFTSHSDIWSFGILLWEIETDGAIPYSGIQAKDLFQTIKSGYRLQKPVKCSDALYDVMTKCWKPVPSERPLFSELCMVLDTLVSRLPVCQEDGYVETER